MDNDYRIVKGMLGEVHFMGRNNVETAAVGGSSEVPFHNGEWVPVVPEIEFRLYWWDFPWILNLKDKNLDQFPVTNKNGVWKFRAGKTTTHLPELCVAAMAPRLATKFLRSRRLAPQIVDFGSEYESVLEHFTESMLGLQDTIPDEKQGLLSKLFEETGYKRQ